MTRASKARILTLAAVVALLGAGIARRTVWRSQPSSQEPLPDPQQTIYAMLSAARDGNVDKYLASFTGPLQANLLHSLADATPVSFEKYLRDSNPGVKGVTVTDPQETGANEVKLRVEYVYQDRTLAQTMYLERRVDCWKISRIDGEQTVKALFPYGTPVR